jgi:hypothetical protein
MAGLFRALFPLILSFSLGEKESAAVPRWRLKVAVTNPAADISIGAGSEVPSPQGPSPVVVEEDFL